MIISNKELKSNQIFNFYVLILYKYFYKMKSALFRLLGSTSKFVLVRYIENRISIDHKIYNVT